MGKNREVIGLGEAIRGDYQSVVEITSKELISETQRKEAVDIARELCAKSCAQVAERESVEIARATLHEAVNSSARYLAENLVEKVSPVARESVETYLRDVSRYPGILQSVSESAEPAAREAALGAIRAWSKERATAAATEAAKHVLNQRLPETACHLLESALLATMHVVMQSFGDQSVPEVELSRLLHEEGEKAALEAAERAYTPEIRRAAQSAAVIAAGMIAKDASEEIAVESAVNAVRQAAVETVRQEVLALVKAEAQRRAARETREVLKDLSAVPLTKVQQHCYDEAMKVARESADAAINEIALPALEVDSQRVFELAAAAASAVAREVSDALLPPKRAYSPWMTLFLAGQVSVGCVLIWYFLLGGNAQLPQLLKPLLPADVFSRMYPKPNVEDDDAMLNNNATLEDVLDDPSPKSNPDNPQAQKGSEATEIKPEGDVPTENSIGVTDGSATDDRSLDSALPKQAPDDDPSNKM